jgi:hypothetical protein
MQVVIIFPFNRKWMFFAKCSKKKNYRTYHLFMRILIFSSASNTFEQDSQSISLI